MTHQIQIETPDIGDNKHFSDVFLIRHAMSDFNYHHALQQKHENPAQQWELLKNEPSIIDTKLHDIGIY
jgi:hypothetical protein